MKLLEYVESNLRGFKRGNPYRYQKGNPHRFQPGHKAPERLSSTQRAVLGVLDGSDHTLKTLSTALEISSTVLAPCLWRLKGRGLVEKVPTCKWRLTDLGRQKLS